LGVAIIILTIIIRFVLLPVFYKSAKDQTLIQKITPKIKELQKTHKDDKERQVKEIMAVYKEHKVNPFSGFILMIIQLPILIALYSVFWRGFSPEILSKLYSFVSAPDPVLHSFLGLFNLYEKNIVLVLIAAVAQYIQSKLLMSVVKNNKQSDKNKGEMSVAEKVSKQMVLIGPFLTFAILYSLPAAVSLYWLTTSVFSVIQQIVINKKINKQDGTDTGDIKTAN
jgi:YidC/Oxa1 family membrane protein insertase